MNKSLQYNYNQKKQKKAPRIAYVPKNSINLTGTNKEAFYTKPMVNPIIPHAYKSSTSLPSYRANPPTKEGDVDDEDDSDKPFLLFEHKLVNANTFMDSQSLKPQIEPTNNKETQVSLKDAVLSLMQKFRERGVKKIINVYQESYRDNKKASGFGDFLRGNYYLMQFCRENYIQFDMNMMNHPLSKCFTRKKPYTREMETIFLDIEPLPGNNFIPYIDKDRTIGYKNDVEFSMHFVKHLLNSPIYKDTIYLYSIAYPYSESISELDKMYIRYCLEPTREIEEYVKDMMNKLNLFTKNYITIHIRSGDRFLIDGATNMSPRYLSQIRGWVNQLLTSGLPSDKYLLLSDNITLKHLLIDEYGERMCATFIPITHSGEGVIITDTSMKNTLLDFYLLSKSSAIYSYSCFNHGTGFSKWTAKTYNIPYICKFVDYI